MAEGRAGIIAAITSPLGFFALTMLIIEGVLGTVVATSKMTGDQQLLAFEILVGLTVVVILVVTVLAVKWPKNLLTQVGSDLERGKAAAEILESPGFRDLVLGFVTEVVKKEALKE